MKKTRNRLALVGLLAAGAAVGAVGAMFARRRRTVAQWNEYEPGIDDIGFADSSVEPGPLTATTKKVAAGAAAMAESVSTQAGKIAESLHERTSAGPSASTSSAAGSSGAGSSGAGSSGAGSSASGPSASGSPASGPARSGTAGAPGASSSPSGTSGSATSASSSASPSASSSSPPSRSAGRPGDPTPGRSDESARALAGKSTGRSPFSAFASDDSAT